MYSVIHSAITEVNSMLCRTLILPLLSAIVMSCLCLSCSGKDTWDGYVPWADDSLSWEYGGCEWTVVFGVPPGETIEDEPRESFLLNLNLDSVADQDDGEDFDASFSIGGGAEILYIEGGGDVAQDMLRTLYYSCNWDVVEAMEPTMEDGTWWRATTGSVETSVTYTEAIESNDCGDFPLYNADIVLSDVFFQNMVTDAVAQTPLSSLILSDVPIGWYVCEG